MKRGITPHDLILSSAPKAVENVSEFGRYDLMEAHRSSLVSPAYMEQFVKRLDLPLDELSPKQDVVQGISSLAVFQLLVSGASHPDDSVGRWSIDRLTNVAQLEMLSARIGKVLLPITATNNNTRKSLTTKPYTASAVQPFVAEFDGDIFAFAGRARYFLQRINHKPNSAQPLAGSVYLKGGESYVKKGLARMTSDENLNAGTQKRANLMLDMTSGNRVETPPTKTEKTRQISSYEPDNFSPAATNDWLEATERAKLAQDSPDDAYMDGARILLKTGIYLNKKTKSPELAQLIKNCRTCLAESEKMKQFTHDADLLRYAPEDLRDLSEVEGAAQILFNVFFDLAGRQYMSAEEQVFLDAVRGLATARFKQAEFGQLKPK